jgi:hypothetical protein
VSSSSLPISVDASAPTVRLHFRLLVTSSSGEPLAGEEVKVRLEGDGSLQPRHDAKDLPRETGPDGSAEVTWYRRSIFGRNLKATISVEAPREGVEATLEATGAVPPLASGATAASATG